MVPKASAIKARLARGSFPLRRKPPSSQTPTKVPTLSKRSTKKKTEMSSPKPSLVAERRSSGGRSMRERGFALGPVFDNVADNFVADDISRFEGGKVSGVIAGNQSFQAVGDGSAGRLAIVIAHGAQDEDALKVDTAALAQERKSL